VTALLEARPGIPLAPSQAMGTFARVAILTSAVLAGSACQPSTHSPELQTLLASEAPPRGVAKGVWSDVTTFYEARGQRLAWVNAKQATEDSLRAVDVLQSAETHGLAPPDYGEADLRASALAMQKPDDVTRARALAEFDVRLTASLLLLGRHVATGRVVPTTVEPRWNVERESPDIVAALTESSSTDIGAFLGAVQPRHPEYMSLRDALVRLHADTGGKAADEARDKQRRTIAHNLERWRWLPDDLGSRHFLVNVPGFHLFARENGKVVLDMRVVVGKRGDETPLFSDEMETVVFSPYWNVPETIALEETAPAVAADPEFLVRNNMEILDADGEVVSADEIPWDDEGALSAYRFRQRPGPTNALGYVKFLFPNKHAVYLHDTPADALFKKIGRAFSHGCIRVEEPEKLASYVLRDQPDWTRPAIEKAMRAGTERHVKLAQKIPVHIVYFTAWVDEQGALEFINDVYGYDARQARR
jgi:murein L,D-transpeptidase YcbB/YkuD